MDESIFDRRLDEQLCFRLYRASTGMSKLYTQALSPFNLTFPQYLVLLSLWDKDGISSTEIGNQTGMGIGTLNPIIKRLESHDWVFKKAHVTDKQKTLIFLEEKASRTKKEINQEIMKQLKGFDYQDIDLLSLMKQLGLLQKQLDNLNSK